MEKRYLSCEHSRYAAKLSAVHCACRQNARKWLSVLLSAYRATGKMRRCGLSG